MDIGLACLFHGVCVCVTKENQLTSSVQQKMQDVFNQKIPGHLPMKIGPSSRNLDYESRLAD